MIAGRLDLLLPLLVQVALTFVLLFAMAGARFGALSRREVKVGDIALGQRAWPTRPTQIANAYHNQLELPVLFYLLVVLVIVTNTSNSALVALAWVFVATRILHAFIHTTSNFVRYRFYAYLAGVFVLIAMWVLFAVRVLTGGIA